MRSVKLVLFGLMFVGLWSMWSNRSFVIAAYTVDDEASSIRLSGVDLVVGTTPIEPSPFVADTAPDTRRRPISLLFTEPSAGGVEVAMSGGTATLSGTVRAPAVVQPQVNSSRRSTTDNDPTDSPSPITVPPPTTPTTPTTRSTSAPGTEPATGSGSGTTPTTEPAGASIAVASSARGIVRLERHTGDGVGVLDVAVGANGTWKATNLPGGRYRLRAWVPGLYRSAETHVTYLEAESSQRFDFDVAPVDSAPQFTFADGGVVYQGLTGSVGILVTKQRVDEEGHVVTSPVVGLALTATEGSIYGVESPNRSATNVEGAITWRLRCKRVGSATLRVREDGSGGTGNPDGIVRYFALPTCIPVPKPTTTTAIAGPPPSSEQRNEAATTTTRRSDRSQTSTTKGDR